MIKKTFKDFILTLEGSSADESELDDNFEKRNPESWKKHKRFIHNFHSALEELPSTSWTDIARNSRYDSEGVWHEINTELKAVGLTWQDVKDNKDVILDNLDCYSSLNAYVDIILYNLDNNYNVGGYPDDVESHFEEILVKYRYGYHQTTYGRIFLKRYWGSVENFVEKYAKNIIKIFIQDTGCIDRSDLGDILVELEEYEGLVDWKDGILKIYFEHFYEIASHGIVSAQVHKLDYEKFKEFFINWLSIDGQELEMEDYGDYLEVDFSRDL